MVSKTLIANNDTASVLLLNMTMSKLSRKNSLYRSYRLTEKHTQIEYCRDLSGSKEEEHRTVTTFVLTQGGLVEIFKDRSQVCKDVLDEYRWTEYVDYVKFIHQVGQEEVEERWKVEKVWTYAGVEEREVLGVKLVPGQTEEEYRACQKAREQRVRIYCYLFLQTYSLLFTYNKCCSSAI